MNGEYSAHGDAGDGLPLPSTEPRKTSPSSNKRCEEPCLQESSEKRIGVGKVEVDPCPLIFQICEACSWVQRHIHLRNVGNQEEMITVSPSNPGLLLLHKGKLLLPPGASVFLPVLVRVPAVNKGLKSADRRVIAERGVARREYLAIRGSTCCLDLPVLLRRDADSGSQKLGIRPSQPRSVLAGADQTRSISFTNPPGHSCFLNMRQCRFGGRCKGYCKDFVERSAFSLNHNGCASSSVEDETTEGMTRSPGKATQVTPAGTEEQPSSLVAPFWGPSPEAFAGETRESFQSRINPGLLAWKLCLGPPAGLPTGLPHSVGSTNSLIKLRAPCTSSSNFCSTGDSGSSTSLKASLLTTRTSPFKTPTTGCLSLETLNRCQKDRKVLAADEGFTGTNISCAQGTSVGPPEKHSEESTTVAEAPSAENSKKRKEGSDVIGFPGTSLDEKAEARAVGKEETIVKEAPRTVGKEKTQVKEAAGSGGTAQLLQDALQRTRKEIEALERFQEFQQATQQPENVETPKSPTQVPDLQRCSNEVMGEEKEQGGVREQAQEVRHDREEHQREVQHSVEKEQISASKSSLDSIYPFKELREITKNVWVACKQDETNSSAKDSQREQQGCADTIPEQQQEKEMREQEIQGLKAALAAARLKHEQQQTLLQQKLQHAVAAAEEAAAEATVVKRREKQLLLELEKGQQQLNAAKRLAAARSSELSRRLQAAVAREEALRRHLKEVQESLRFLYKLKHVQPCAAEWSLNATRQKARGKAATKSLSSCWTCGSLNRCSSSKRTGPGTGLQCGQQAEVEGKQKRLQEDRLQGFCVIEIPEEIQPLIDRLDSSRDSKAAAASADDMPPPSVSVPEVNQQVEMSASLDSPGSFSIFSPRALHQRIKESPSGHSDGIESSRGGSGGCCGAFCSSVFWELQHRLCKTTAGLITKTQLLVAREARDKELRQQAADNAAAAERAEAAASAAEEKLFCIMAKNAALQDELMAATETQRQQGAEATEAKVANEAMRISERWLSIRCELLIKEKETWKRQMQQQLEHQQQRMRQQQQQQFFISTQRVAEGYSQDPAAGERLPSGFCFVAAEEAANKGTTRAAAADVGAVADKDDPLVCAMQRLAERLYQLNKAVAFVRERREIQRGFSFATAAPQTSETLQQQHEKLQISGTSRLLCRWPEGSEASVTGREYNSEEDINDNNDKELADKTGWPLTDRAEELIRHVCAALLAVGWRLKASHEEQRRLFDENLMIREILKTEKEKSFRIQNENLMLNAQRAALDAKIALLEQLATVEREQAAQTYTEQKCLLSRQLEAALEALREREHERVSLLKQQRLLTRKVKKLQGSFQSVLVKCRKKVATAKASAEDAVLQQLSEWRESLVKTTLEAAGNSCCSPCYTRSSSASCERSSLSCWGKGASLRAEVDCKVPASNGLARRHAAAELAILELTDALSKSNLLLACSERVATPEGKTAQQALAADEVKCRLSPAAQNSEPPESPQAPSDGQEFPPFQQVEPNSVREEHLCEGFPQEKDLLKRIRLEEAAGCICGHETGTSALHSHYLRQKRLLAAYETQQQELNSKWGALKRALAEVSTLGDCLKALKARARDLEEAAAKGEAAQIEKESLRSQVHHLQACLLRERGECVRELQLLRATQAAALRQDLEVQHEGVLGALKEAQEEAATARRELQQQQTEAEKLQRQISQLQKEAAEHVVTADHLVKALVLCGPAAGRNPGTAAAATAAGFSDLPMPEEFCVRLVALERDRVASVLPSFFLQQLPPFRLLKGPQASSQTEELLLAHRLLLAALMHAQAQNGRHSFLWNPSQGETEGQQRESQGHRPSLDSANTIEGPCQSLVAAAVTQLFSSGSGAYFFLTRSKGSSCSKCLARSLVSRAVTAAHGFPKQRAMKEAEAKAARLLHYVQNLGNCLIFLAAAQHRICALLEAKQCRNPLAADTAPSHVAAVTSLADPAATEAWMLLRHLQNVAAKAAEELREANTLNFSLSESLIGLCAGNVAGPLSHIKASRQNLQDGTSLETTSVRIPPTAANQISAGKAAPPVPVAFFKCVRGFRPRREFGSDTSRGTRASLRQMPTVPQSKLFSTDATGARAGATYSSAAILAPEAVMRPAEAPSRPALAASNESTATVEELPIGRTGSVRRILGPPICCNRRCRSWDHSGCRNMGALPGNLQKSFTGPDEAGCEAALLKKARNNLQLPQKLRGPPSGQPPQHQSSEKAQQDPTQEQPAGDMTTQVEITAPERQVLEGASQPPHFLPCGRALASKKTCFFRGLGASQAACRPCRETSLPLLESGTAALQQQPILHLPPCAGASNATVEPNHVPQQHLQQRTDPHCCGKPTAQFSWGAVPSNVNPLCHSAGIPVQQQAIEQGSTALNRTAAQKILVKTPWISPATNSKQQHQNRQLMLRLEPMTLNLQALSSQGDKPHHCLCADSDTEGLMRVLGGSPLQYKNLHGPCGSGVYATLRAVGSAAGSKDYLAGVKGPTASPYETSLRYLKQNARAVAAEINYSCQ